MYVAVIAHPDGFILILVDAVESVDGFWKGEKDAQGDVLRTHPPFTQAKALGGVQKRQIFPAEGSCQDWLEDSNRNLICSYLCHTGKPPQADCTFLP